MAKANEVSAVRKAKHGWLLTLFFSILSFVPDIFITFLPEAVEGMFVLFFTDPVPAEYLIV